MRYLCFFLILFILLALQTKLFAQACCTWGAPITTNLGIQSYSAKQLAIDLSYDYNSLRDLYAASQNLHDSRRTRQIKSLFLRTSFALNDKWSFSVILPYLWQEQVVRSDFEEPARVLKALGTWSY